MQVAFIKTMEMKQIKILKNKRDTRLEGMTILVPFRWYKLRKHYRSFEPVRAIRPMLSGFDAWEVVA